MWDKENDEPRTIRENEALKYTRSLSSTYKNEEKEKTGKSCDFSGNADRTIFYALTIIIDRIGIC